MEMIPKRGLDDRELKKVEAMIQSMTRQREKIRIFLMILA